MRKLAGAVMAAVVAVLAFGAIMASSAAAASHPLFLTESKKALLFTGEGNNPVLQGLQGTLKATVSCEKVLVHGFVLHESSLAHLKELLFEDKCLQRVNGGAIEECSPLLIKTKTILAELGLLNETTKTVVLLLAPDDGTTVFAKFTCGAKETTVGGVIVGEIPAENAKLEKQYNVSRTELELIFATNPAGSDHQAITTIFLLGAEMTKQELKVEGFLGETAAQEVTVILKSDGGVTIDA